MVRSTVKYPILIDEIKKSQKTTAPQWKRFSQKHHLSSTESSKSNFDFSYLLILTSHIRSLIQNSNFVIRQVYKVIYPLSSVHFLPSLIQKLLTVFFRFTPVLAHLEIWNQMEVIDALISYVLVKFWVNVKCKDKTTREETEVPKNGLQKNASLYLPNSIAIHSLWGFFLWYQLS